VSVVHLVCRGCGQTLPVVGEFFASCPDRIQLPGTHHILEKCLDRQFNHEDFLQIPNQPTNPYLFFAEFFYSYHLGVFLGADYAGICSKIQHNLLSFDSPGFQITPLREAEKLSKELSLPDGSRLLIKDETSNVGGSHKARFLMGTLIYLEVLRSTGQLERPDLAIYSCGNAALGASYVARAGGYNLDVFVPPALDPLVQRDLEGNHARVHFCERREGEVGDPCYLRYQESLRGGCIPFSCSGPDNWSNIEGGQTLFLELVFQLLKQELELDSIFIQCGGGALGSAGIQTFQELYHAGTLSRIPKIYTVQTEGAFPLVRAYLMLLKQLGKEAPMPCSIPDPGQLGYFGKILTYLRNRTHEYKALAEWVRAKYSSKSIAKLLAESKDSLMWTWEDSPKSSAHGILDDYTYDWMKLVEGMIQSGGYPIVVSEEELERANGMAGKYTGISVDHTGTAGLAGLLSFLKIDEFQEHEKIGLLFTGVKRESGME